MSVRLYIWNNSAPNEWIFMKFEIFVKFDIFVKFEIYFLFENLSRKFKINYNRTRITDNLHEDQYKFLIISRSFFLTTRNVSDKSCRENQNTHFIFSNFFPKFCLLCNNVEKYCTAEQATHGNMAHAHWILDK
jgi:hypothetical protein